MVLALAVLAYMLYITMFPSTTTPTTTTSASEAFTTVPQRNANLLFNAVAPAKVAEADKIVAPVPQLPNAPAPVPVPEPMGGSKIVYDNFANAQGMEDNVNNAAPFKTAQAVEQGDYATVKYSGLVDANPGDVIQIEGTDLLTAPLVDNMLYTNSIANTNRNASNDLRGDIPLQFNDTYTTFYSSVIYGAPLSQHNMTIGKL
jgi:hypothetical protein